MSITESYEGVRHVVVDNLGGGSITVEPGSRQDLVEAWIDADDRFLEQVQIRQDHDWLRISLPHHFVWSTKAQLRLGVPDGLTFVIKTGSADISISADIGRSKITSGSGDITVGNATDLECSTGSGNISVARVDGDGARLSSGSGDVAVGEAELPHHGEVRFRRGGREVPKRCQSPGQLWLGRHRRLGNERLSRSTLGLGLPDSRRSRQPARLARPQLRVRRHPDRPRVDDPTRTW